VLDEFLQVCSCYYVFTFRRLVAGCQAAQKEKREVQDYIELHLIVDDAFTYGENGVGISNEYVLTLRSVVEAVFPHLINSRSWKTGVRTPYGARTEVTLLQPNVILFLHLKDVSMLLSMM